MVAIAESERNMIIIEEVVVRILFGCTEEEKNCNQDVLCE